MMKNLITICVIFAICPTVANALVTIDFEGLPYTAVTTSGNITPVAGSVLTDDFMSVGVLFGKEGTSAGVAVVRDSFAPSSGSNSVAGLDASGMIPSSGGGAAIGDIYFSFVSPGSLMPSATDWVSFTIGDGGGDLDVFQIRSYTLGGSLIDTQDLSNTSRFPVTIAMSGIHRVEVDFTGDYGYSLDDLSFNSPTVIPAPGAILLGSIGISLVNWLRRRRTI
jgi:hypothetical protein